MKDIIAKAVEGGYQGEKDLVKQFLNPDNPSCKMVADTLIEGSYFDSIIFSHDFLKAFFGERLVKHGYGENPNGLNPYFLERVPRWQYHAQQLVLSEDRIKYLEGFLE